jgi:hypothetical protein
MRAFEIQGPTVNVDVGAASANVLIGRWVGAVRVMNNGTATAWIAFGTDNTIAATLAAGVPVGPGVTEILSPPPQSGGTLYVAAIAAGSTGKIYFTPGSGI